MRWQDGAGWILDRGDGVDEFRGDAARLEARQNFGQRVHANAVRINGNRHDVSADLAEAVDRALVAEFFQNDGIARLHQQGAHHINPLAGA